MGRIASGGPNPTLLAKALKYKHLRYCARHGFALKTKLGLQRCRQIVMKSITPFRQAS
jgi:hypothetical protein